MKFDISKKTAPKMPKLGKRNENSVIFALTGIKAMHKPIVPMIFPVLGAHASGAKFMYPDLSWKEMCGTTGDFVADSGCNKRQLTNITETILHRILANLGCRNYVLRFKKMPKITSPVGEKKFPSWRKKFPQWENKRLIRYLK